MSQQEGKPIWCESLLTAQEYKEQSKKHPTTFTKGDTAPALFECEFKWRQGMGAVMNVQEVKLINQRLDAVLKKAGLL